MKFVDTNIFVYSLLAGQSSSKHDLAALLLSSDDLIISTQIVNELSSVLKSKARMGEPELRLIVEDLYLRFEVVECGSADIFEAFELRDKYHISFWDSLVVATALRTGADQLITEDLQDNLVIESRLIVRNPFL